MAFKIVGADENSDFPARVETRLAEKFADTAYVDSAVAAVELLEGPQGPEGPEGPQGPQGEPGTASGVVEDPADPGFFI